MEQKPGDASSAQRLEMGKLQPWLCQKVKKHLSLIIRLKLKYMKDKLLLYVGLCAGLSLN